MQLFWDPYAKEEFDLLAVGERALEIEQGSVFDPALTRVSCDPKNSVVVFSLHRVMTAPLEWSEYKGVARQMSRAAITGQRDCAAP